MNVNAGVTFNHRPDRMKDTGSSFSQAEPAETVSSLEKYKYHWPREDLSLDAKWTLDAEGKTYFRNLPESEDELERDSRWPLFFSSPICLVTTSDGESVFLEKVVGPSIVNRFPYILALSFCRTSLSDRHHVRSAFMKAVENSGSVAVQFLAPGPLLDRALSAIEKIPQEQCSERLGTAGLKLRPSRTNSAPVMSDAYLVYECKLVKPQKDLYGEEIFPEPYKDVGSHRVYFFEINCIQLRHDIADGRSQINWCSLAKWDAPKPASGATDKINRLVHNKYVKPYTPFYRFPNSGTIAFRYDEVEDGMACMHLPPLPSDQVEVDNDRARWPCFFPSSLGLITSKAPDGTCNVMPCGSTTILSRHPLIVAPCLSYAAINERYAPRATLDIIRSTGRFGCGVPFANEEIVDAIRYAGNISVRDDLQKFVNTGLELDSESAIPKLSSLPLNFECEVIGEVKLGTHIMFLGEVKRIYVRSDVGKNRAMEWLPWADIAAAS